MDCSQVLEVGFLSMELQTAGVANVRYVSPADRTFGARIRPFQQDFASAKL